MGSLQQIFLGAICVGGAFLMGHYLNHQTPSNSLFEKKAPTAETAQGPQNLLQQRETTAMLPNFRTQSKLGPAFGLEKDLPPPSQLDGADSSPSTASQTPSQLNLADQELDIEVPDFSALAAQFKGTALELPALNAAPAVAADSHRANPAPEAIRRDDNSDGISLPPFNEPAVSSTTAREQGLSPHVPANAEVRVPNFRTKINPVEEQLRAERESVPRGNPVTESTETSFRPEDFAPRLRVDNAGAGINPANSNQETNLDFATTDLSEVSPFPPSNSVLETDRSVAQARHPNAVISYNDPFPNKLGDRTPAASPAASIDPPMEFGSGLNSSQGQNSAQTPGWDKRKPVETDRAQPDRNSGQWSVRDREATTEFEQPLNSGGLLAATIPTDETNARIPFGLNDGEKNRLSRLNPASSQPGEVEATRFEEYKTEFGDTLTSISKRFYGKPEYYLDIYLANRHQLRNPAQVPVGIILRLPVYE